MSNNGKTVVFCDFDGTITVQDSLDTVFDHFAPADWRQIGSAVRARGGTRASIPVEVALCRADRQDFERVVREKIAVTPGFGELLELCREQDWEFVILSEGFALHIDTVLKREGLAGLRYYSNDLVFHDEGVGVAQPHSNPECLRCGNCKTAHIERYRAQGYHIIYIGDGFTDYCPAGHADFVVAKRVLAEYCEREGIDYEPFSDFHDVVRVLRRSAAQRAEE